MKAVKGLDIAPGERLLIRDISLVLLFKLAAITLLWYLFFSPAHQMMVTPAKVDGQLFTAPPAGHPIGSRPRS